MSTFAPRYLIKGELVVKTPLHVGSGSSVADSRLGDQESGGAPPECDCICQDGDGRPFIPGASIKGALRALAAERGNARGAGALFGVAHDKGGGQMGALVISGAPIERQVENAEPEGASESGVWPHLANGVCVSARSARHEGRGVAAADRGALFHAQQAPPKTRFQFRARYFPGLAHGKEDESEGLLRRLLSELQTTGLRLGAGRAQGDGLVILEDVSVTRENLDAEGSLISTIVVWRIGDTPLAESTDRIHMMRLECEGPFYVDDWAYREKRSRTKDVTAATCRALRSDPTTPRLDGASVKGALRARSAWLERVAGSTDAVVTKRLFGGADASARLQIAVRCLKSGAKHRSESVSLDRFSGAPIDGALYSVETFFGPEFEVTLSLRPKKRDAKNDVAADSAFVERLIGDIEKNGVEFGHSPSSGFGWFRIKDAPSSSDWADAHVKAFVPPIPDLNAATYTNGPDPGYLVAPYRFVHVPDAVAKPQAAVREALTRETDEQGLGQSAAKGDGATLLSHPLSKGLSGALEIDWQAEAPILIGASRIHERNGRTIEVDEPIGLVGGDYWIPGATIKGMLRACAEIAGYAHLTRSNRDHVFPSRNFNNPKYQAAIAASAIQGGWLWRDEEGGCAIQPAGRPLLIAIESIVQGIVSDRRLTRGEWLKNKSVQERYELVGAKNRGANLLHHQERCFREIAVDHDRRIVEPDEEGNVTGYLVLANRLLSLNLVNLDQQEGVKRYEHVFAVAPDRSKAIPIDRQAWRRFEFVNTRAGKRGRREPDGTWAILEPLLSGGSAIPVFYAGDLNNQNADFAFGITRAFKIAHTYSLGDAIGRMTAHALSEEPDMVEALFGHVWDARPDRTRDVTRALKSRLSFSGARIKASAARVSDEITTIMMAPRASFGPFYLAGKNKDWSDGSARIAGRKRYPPRPHATLGAVRARLAHQIAAAGGRAGDSATILKLLTDSDGKGGPAFTSRIRFHNVTEAELGLLIFAITHGGHIDGPYRHVVGRAKPFGAGRLAVAGLRIRARDGKPMDGCMDECLNAFVQHMNGGADNFWGREFPGAEDRFPNTKPIQEWLYCSDPKNGAVLPGPAAGRVGPQGDVYLRLRYDDGTNPYQELRGARGGPDRLLPGAPLPKRQSRGGAPRPPRP